MTLFLDLFSFREHLKRQFEDPEHFVAVAAEMHLGKNEDWAVSPNGALRKTLGRDSSSTQIRHREIAKTTDTATAGHAHHRCAIADAACIQLASCNSDRGVIA